MIVYTPYKGREQELLPAVKASFADLRLGGYVTAQPPMLMKSADGSIILIFEFKDEPMIRKAEADPVMQKHWMTLSKLCEFEKPINLVEFQQPFSEFETIDWND
jgi:hypothetical protein